MVKYFPYCLLFWPKLLVFQITLQVELQFSIQYMWNISKTSLFTLNLGSKFLPFLSILLRNIKTKWEKIKQRTSSPLFWIRICSWPCFKYLQFFVHVIRSSLFSLVKLFYVKIPILSCAKLFPAIFIVIKMHNSTWIFCENDENRGCCLV